jgi:hypothetical protein
LKSAAVGGAGIVAAKLGAEPPQQTPAAKGKSMINVPFERHDVVRLAFIGLGARGSGLLSDYLAIDGVRVTALCDIDKNKVLAGQKAVMAKGQSEPAGYWKDEKDFENLAKRTDIDAIVIATPWDWHVPMSLAAMNNGHHAFSEVPAAETIADCWNLVDTSERTRKHCVMMENCCYGANEMMVYQMVKSGLLGEVTHAEGAYIHDLRSLLTADQSEGLWRRFPHIKRNGNFYPTHGLGPIANYFDINRGDKFDFIVSMSSPQASLEAYVKDNFPAGDPKRREKYICGDMNTSLIKCHSGKTIKVQHDVVTPRPYSRLNMVQGTKGTFSDYPAQLAIDADGAHEWLAAEKYAEYEKKYEHPMWKRVGELARQNGGHGGMDFVLAWRLIQCMKEGRAPDMDCYDAASWSAPTPLSQDSVKKGSVPLPFPDFTRGRWSEKRVIWEM